jgi:peroxidase
MQLPLSMLHIIFLRLHNDLVEKLRYMNPHWKPERLFEEARRIVIAYNQHITINEWLPAMLDWTYLDAYKLRPAKVQSTYIYEQYINAYLRKKG